MPLSCNLGTLTSWNPLGHSRPVKRLLYFNLYLYLMQMQCSKSRPGLTGIFSSNLLTIVLSFSGLDTELQCIYLCEINHSECQSWFSFGQKFKFNFNNRLTCLTKYYQEDELGRTCVRYGGQPEGVTPREICRRIWEQNCEIDFKK